jgi:hypothetical protein
MKIARLSLFLATVLALSLFVCVRPASAQGAADAARSGHSEASLVGGTPINAELNSSIDSKKAKSGDSVVAHTTGVVKSTDDRIILPRGTKLVGHIGQASARSKGDNDSAVTIGFDKAILKGGEEMPLSVTIRALAGPSPNAFGGGAGPESMSGPSSPSNYPSGSGNGGGMNNKPPMSDAPRSYPGAGGASTEATSSGGTNSSGELAPNSRGVIGLNGLTLSLAGAENAPVSVISSTGKNVHLDGGTRLLLVTEAPPSEAPGQ